MVKITYELVEFTIEDSIHIILFYAILASFYFFYVSKYEEHHIHSLFQDTTGLNPDNKVDTEFEQSVHKYLKEKISASDWEKIKQNAGKQYQIRQRLNSELKRKAIIIGVIMTIVLFTICIYMWKNLHVKVKPDLIDNLIDTIIIVIILASIEIAFFFFIVKKYMHVTHDEEIYNLIKTYR